ncbi:MAG TPA: response regulator, partial [Candidatus Dormibacteraeota bacterium]|nr:response regulator [Candidatus Dormibacteraeota bacterium]
MITTIRVLVIEDHPPLLRMISDMLGQAVEALFQVESTARLGDALERLAAGSIDVVLLDLNLPDASGWELCRQIRAEPSPPEVVIVSANAHENTEEARHMHGCAGFISKPVR